MSGLQVEMHRLQPGLPGLQRSYQAIYISYYCIALTWTPASCYNCQTSAALQAMVSCAINGFGLALVIPCVQSLVADYHPSESRGKAFGFMFFTASCGKLAVLAVLQPALLVSCLTQSASVN